MKRRVYCEFEFLKYFVSNIPQNRNNLYEWDSFASWRKMFDFLKKSTIIVDVSKLHLFEECQRNSILHKLYTINQDWKCLGEKFPYINKLDNDSINKNNRFFSIFLTTLKKRIHEEISRNLGVIILGKSDITKFESYFEEKTIPIPQNSSFSWKDVLFKEMIRKSNSMIIVDNYILDDTKLLEKNLKPLLEAILPNYIEVDYHLTLFCKLTGTSKSKSDNDGKVRYEKAFSIVSEIFKTRGNSFKLSLVDSDDFHDRIIVTNNAWIDCGAGFNLVDLKDNSSKRTNVRMAFPFLTSGNMTWVDDAFSFLLHDCEEAKCRCKKVWGNIENRLLYLI
jgi:hypothetical protein